MNWLLLLLPISILAGMTPDLSLEVGHDVTDAGGLSNWPAQPASFANGVTAIGDVIYAQPLHHRPLRLDIYRPAEQTAQPLLVHVHGGAWLKGTKRLGGPIRNYPAVLAQIAARGYVVASIEYRLDGEAKFPTAIQDVKTAIRFLRQHARDYGIDPARVGIFGESAGGQLSALAATSCGVVALEPAADGRSGDLSDCVQAAAPWYGVYDFETLPIPAGGAGPASYLGCPSRDCSAERLRFASPAAYVDADDPPMFLVHGNADALVAVSQTHEFEDRLRKAGVPVKALYLPDVDHGLVGKTNHITAAAIRRAIAETVAFFDGELKK